MSGLLTIAEASLEADLPTWRTDTLVQLTGPQRIVNPSAVPVTSRHAYDTLWRNLDFQDATELLKYLAQRVLATRQVEESFGACPRCGAEYAKVLTYDGGRYQWAWHKAPYQALGGKAVGSMPLQRCYAGPVPVPSTYEGDL